ncbi:hypothetical protein HYV12_00400 [Candidatus Dojkabacteria bacterium]|nr:hypothetical protein [Candidatus Dojkabacteria bacterium]
MATGLVIGSNSDMAITFPPQNTETSFPENSSTQENLRSVQTFRQLLYGELNFQSGDSNQIWDETAVIEAMSLSGFPVENFNDESLSQVAHDVSRLHRLIVERNSEFGDNNTTTLPSRDLVAKLSNETQEAMLLDAYASVLGFMEERAKNWDLPLVNGNGLLKQFSFGQLGRDGVWDKGKTITDEMLENFIAVLITDSATLKSSGIESKGGSKGLPPSMKFAFGLLVLSIVAGLVLSSNDKLRSNIFGSTSSNNQPQVTEQVEGNQPQIGSGGGNDDPPILKTPVPPTVTFTPIPPNGIENLAKQFAELSGGAVLVKPDGTFYNVVNGVEYPIEGAMAQNDGSLSILVNSATGEKQTLSADQWYVDRFGLVILDHVYNYETNSWEKIPDKDFQKTPLESYRNQVLSEQDILNGSYCKFVLENYPHQFKKGEYENVPWRFFGDFIKTTDKSLMSTPNDDGSTHGWFWKFTAAQLIDRNGLEYIVIPIIFPDPADPENIEKNICVLGVNVRSRLDNPGQKTAGYDSPAFDLLNRHMAAPYFGITTRALSSKLEIPFIARIYGGEYGSGDTQAAMESLVKGNPRLLRNRVASLEILRPASQ